MNRAVWGALVVFACLVLPSAASAVLVGEGSDSGIVPNGEASGWLYSPSNVRVEVTASPEAPLELHLDLQCWRGKVNRRVTKTLPPRTGPIRRKVALPLRNPDECHLDAWAWYAGTEAEGEIRTRLFGHGRLKLH